MQFLTRKVLVLLIDAVRDIYKFTASPPSKQYRDNLILNGLSIPPNFWLNTHTPNRMFTTPKCDFYQPIRSYAYQYHFHNKTPMHAVRQGKIALLILGRLWSNNLNKPSLLHPSTTRHTYGSR